MTPLLDAAIRWFFRTHGVVIHRSKPSDLSFSIGFCQSDHVEVAAAEITADTVLDCVPDGVYVDHHQGFLPVRKTYRQRYAELFGFDHATDGHEYRRSSFSPGEITDEPDSGSLCDLDETALAIDSVHEQLIEHVRNLERKALQMAHSLVMGSAAFADDDGAVLREFRTRHWFVRFTAHDDDHWELFDDEDCIGDVVEAVLAKRIELVPELHLTLAYFSAGVPDDVDLAEADAIHQDSIFGTCRATDRKGTGSLPDCWRDLFAEARPEKNPAREQSWREAA